jgi:murein DD-endopeptidase MepM/ murein hydrolase activator NlpD
VARVTQKRTGEQDSVTFMYVPGEAGRIRRVSVPRVWLRRGAIAIGVVMLFIAGASVDYIRVRRMVNQVHHLRDETHAQREQIVAYSKQVEAIAERLDKVSRLDRKLRVITNLAAADPLPLPGIGGLEGSALLEPHGHQRMTETLDQLKQAADVETQSLEQLLSHLEDQSARLGATPSIAPTHGWVTSGFGYRTSPFTSSREFHRGLDIAGRMKTPVLAPADGEVRIAGHARALGKTITITHGYGIETVYGHLAEVLVKPGAKVKRGQQIGLMGNTGRSTGPHLHYQVEVNGKPVNPQNYILD